jgi:hypothetical protein
VSGTEYLAALDQVAGFAAFRAELPDLIGLKRGFPEIDIRIGIATGDVVVGSIGSEQTRNYTVIGDTIKSAIPRRNTALGHRCQKKLSHQRQLSAQPRRPGARLGERQVSTRSGAPSAAPAAHAGQAPLTDASHVLTPERSAKGIRGCPSRSEARSWRSNPPGSSECVGR